MRFHSLFMLLPLLSGTITTTSASPTNTGVSSSSSSPLLEARQQGNCQCPQPDGEFPNPCRCAQYLTCRDNIAIVRYCPPGQLYHSGWRVCTSDRVAQCAPRQDCCSSS